MRSYRIGEAADLLGVSADTVRRWVDSGRLAAARDRHGRRLIDGADLAGFARSATHDPSVTRDRSATHDRSATRDDERPGRSSARNQFRGIVTAVTRDTVMAQVEIQAGPFRVVSLMSREAADELGLGVGEPAIAVVKSTAVVVELPG